MTVHLYVYDENLNLLDKGKFDSNRLDELFDNRLANREIVFDDFETMIRKTRFMLSRSKMDYINVSIDGLIDKNMITIFSEIYPDTFWGKIQKLFYFKKFVYHTKVDLPTAKMICQDYVALDRQEFEHKYQEFCLLKSSSDGD